MNIPQKKNKPLLQLITKNYYAYIRCVVIKAGSGLTRDGGSKIYSLTHNNTVEQILDETCGMKQNRNN